MNKHLKQWYSFAVRNGYFRLANKILFQLNNAPRMIFFRVADGDDEAYQSGFANWLMDNSTAWVNTSGGFTAKLPVEGWN